MYNAEQKERFIKDYTTKISVRKAAKTVLDLFGQYEERWESDMCTQDADTLQVIFNQVAGVRKGGSRIYVSILRAYGKWCLQNGIPGATDGLLSVNAEDGSEKLKYQTVRNPRHLQSFLDLICDQENEKTSDNNIRSYCWLAYAGLSNEDALTIRTQDIDLQNMTINVSGVSYPIYREALPAIRNCATLSSFLYKHPNYSANKIVYRPRIPGDLLLRGIKANPTAKTLRVELSYRNKKVADAGKTNLDLSYFRIWISGVFYRMYEDEMAGFPVDFSFVANQKLGDTPRDRGRQREVEHSYEEDYERWKQAIVI